MGDGRSSGCVSCVRLSVCLSVCLSVWKVYCGKMTDWIRMLFRVMNGVGRGMAVLDGVVIVEEEATVFFWGGEFGDAPL